MNLDPLSPEALEDYSTSDLEALRDLVAASHRHNRQKVMIALNGFVATHGTLMNIIAELKKPKHQKQTTPPDSAA